MKCTDTTNRRQAGAKAINVQAIKAGGGVAGMNSTIIARLNQAPVSP
jgi:hypothetical protein